MRILQVSLDRMALMRDDVNCHEVEACVGSEFVFVVIALVSVVFHSCLLLMCLTGVLHMVVKIVFVSLTTDPGIVCR